MSKFKKKIIIFFWVVFNLIFLNVKIFAQQLSQVMPPSPTPTPTPTPTAASIAQFADVPVSNYTQTLINQILASKFYYTYPFDHR